MTKNTETINQVVIKFAGDSGDGMQFTGGQFTDNTALAGHDLATFPDYPAEIRAPIGTTAGVSGFQLHFGSTDIYTPGDACDVLVAMNAAALKVNLSHLRHSAIIIANISGFDKRNLRLAGYESNPIEDGSLEGRELITIDVTRLTRECLKDLPLSTKEKDRSKNMFILGLLYWMYDRETGSTEKFLKKKFGQSEDILEANIRALKAGYNYGDTTQVFTTRFKINPAPLNPGTYRGIVGNEATGLGLIAAARKAGLPLFLGSYPITPASDILHFLARYKNFDVRTFQAEDEIAAIGSALGASFGGHLGVTTTSGPGMALKTETIGLAIMLELPLVICNIQRAGPSTGLPTKTEQADLFQAMYGRNGESPLPIIAAHSPSDAFGSAFEACRIAIEHMTPVIFLSDGYIGNGMEPWRFPSASDLPEIKVPFINKMADEGDFQPYLRDERLVRKWAIPGTKGLEHRLGGLEKEDVTGNVSYDPQNHDKMVRIREEKVQRIADSIPELTIDFGPEYGEVLLLGWGSTFGSCQSAASKMQNKGYAVSHAHLRYLNPFPANLHEVLRRFKKVIVPEINSGQLLQMIRAKYLVDASGFNRVKGLPLSSDELVETIEKEIRILKSNTHE